MTGKKTFPKDFVWGLFFFFFTVASFKVLWCRPLHTPVSSFKKLALAASGFALGKLEIN